MGDKPFYFWMVLAFVVPIGGLVAWLMYISAEWDNFRAEHECTATGHTREHYQSIPVWTGKVMIMQLIITRQVEYSCKGVAGQEHIWH